MSKDLPFDPERREWLGKLTTAVGAVGIAGACWPLIRSMNPTVDVIAKANTEVDLATIPPGKVETVAWQGKPVFVLHRTPEEIAAMAASSGVKDPQPDSARVQKPEWLVVVGICTHLGCVPNRNENGWLCPCHGSVYDNSGRILRGPAPRNLEVPPYKFIAADKIIIGKT